MKDRRTDEGRRGRKDGGKDDGKIVETEEETEGRRLKRGKKEVYGRKEDSRVMKKLNNRGLKY